MAAANGQQDTARLQAISVQLQEKCADLEAATTRLRDENRALQETRMNLRAKLATAAAKAERLQKSVEQLQEENLELSSQVAAHSCELEQAQQAADARIAEMAEVGTSCLPCLLEHLLGDSMAGLFYLAYALSGCLDAGSAPHELLSVQNLLA
jgi:DNA repair exonuclease SbcCD ATPase subunit